jgi:hypothetical protein
MLSSEGARASQVVCGGFVAGIDAQRLLELSNCFIDPPGCSKRAPQVVSELRIVAAQAHGPLEARNGLGEAAAPGAIGQSTRVKTNATARAFPASKGSTS